MSRTNEIKKILEFFKRVEDAYEELYMRSESGLGKGGTFYERIFDLSTKISREKLYRMQIAYFDIIEDSIGKVKNKYGDASEMICAVLMKIQDDILKLTYNTSSNEIDVFRKKCQNYALQIQLFEVSYARDFDEVLIEERQLKEIEEKIESLNDEIKASDIDDELKHNLLNQLFLVKMSLEQYRLLGEKALTRDINALVGTVAIEGQKYKDKESAERKILAKVAEAAIGFLKIFVKEGVSLVIKDILKIE